MSAVVVKILERERACICSLGNVPADQHVHNFDKTLERTASFDKLVSSCHALIGHY